MYVWFLYSSIYCMGRERITLADCDVISPTDSRVLVLFGYLIIYLACPM